MIPDAPPRILIIDDEVAVSMILARTLRPWPVAVVHDGVSATARLAERRWDAVLCDLSLPGVDGITLYERSSPAQRERFVFLTGGATSATAQRFIESCGTPTLFKPFEPDAVRTEVARLLALDPVP